MESLVVSLETAQKLKAAGFSQRGTYWVWRDIGERVPGNYEVEWRGKRSKAIPFFAAPTAQEIADQLPKATIIHKSLGEGYAAYSGKTMFASSASLRTTALTMVEVLAQLWLKVHESDQPKQ